MKMSIWNKNKVAGDLNTISGTNRYNMLSPIGTNSQISNANFG
jgi:hypothetical protein